MVGGVWCSTPHACGRSGKRDGHSEMERWCRVDSQAREGGREKSRILGEAEAIQSLRPSFLAMTWRVKGQSGAEWREGNRGEQPR